MSSRCRRSKNQCLLTPKFGLSESFAPFPFPSPSSAAAWFFPLGLAMEFASLSLSPWSLPPSAQEELKQIIAGKMRLPSEEALAELDELGATGKRSHERAGAVAGSAQKQQKTEDSATPATASRSLASQGSTPASSFPQSGRAALASPIPPFPVLSVFGFGHRQARAAKGQLTRQKNFNKAAEWEATSDSRPFRMADLSDPEKCDGALRFFNSLSAADLKSECLVQDLPVTGSKDKLVKSLIDKARFEANGNPSRGLLPASASASAAGEKAPSVSQVRRALVADLRKGLVFDKKLKKGAGKMLKGARSGSLFSLSHLFSHVAHSRFCSFCSHVALSLFCSLMSHT